MTFSTKEYLTAKSVAISATLLKTLTIRLSPSSNRPRLQSVTVCNIGARNPILGSNKGWISKKAGEIIENVQLLIMVDHDLAEGENKVPAWTSRTKAGAKYFSVHLAASCYWSRPKG